LDTLEPLLGTALLGTALLGTALLGTTFYDLFPSKPDTDSKCAESRSAESICAESRYRYGGKPLII
jgi:hypothetical protein